MEKKDNNIYLHSDQGQKLLKDVHGKGEYYQHFLHGIFAKQIGRKNCGITTLAMLMSAAKLHHKHQGSSTPELGTKYIPPIPEAKMFEFQEILAVANQETVDKGGLTLDQLLCMVKGFKYEIYAQYASEATVDDFRKSSKKALEKGNSQQGVIVNYLMSSLGNCSFGGHFSPIAAYHENTDRFLILDTWPETEEVWVKTDDIFRAMNTMDDTSGKSRGFCIINLP